MTDCFPYIISLGLDCGIRVHEQATILAWIGLNRNAWHGLGMGLELELDIFASP